MNLGFRRTGERADSEPTALRSPRWFLPKWPVAYPASLRTSARLGEVAYSPSLSPSWPTVVMPERIGYWPVMKAAQPAVQDGWA